MIPENPHSGPPHCQTDSSPWQPRPQKDSGAPSRAPWGQAGNSSDSWQYVNDSRYEGSGPLSLHLETLCEGLSPQVWGPRIQSYEVAKIPPAAAPVFWEAAPAVWGGKDEPQQHPGESPPPPSPSALAPRSGGPNRCQCHCRWPSEGHRGLGAEGRGLEELREAQAWALGAPLVQLHSPGGC